MRDLLVIDDPQAATVSLDPVRTRLLAELASAPASAAALAGRLDIPRQKINYHLRELESHNLVELAGSRQWGGITERLMVASASAYVVSPSAFGPLAPDPARSRDRLSASYLIALAARAVHECHDLLRRSEDAGQHLATLSLDTEVRFRSPAERAAFTAELTRSVLNLVARYHDPTASEGRDHRLVVLAHPLPKPPEAAKE